MKLNNKKCETASAKRMGQNSLTVAGYFWNYIKMAVSTGVISIAHWGKKRFWRWGYNRVGWEAMTLEFLICATLRS